MLSGLTLNLKIALKSERELVFGDISKKKNEQIKKNCALPIFSY